MSRSLRSSIDNIYKQGQSIWLDYIDTDLVENGGLDELISRGIRGITSNPSILQKAYSRDQYYSIQITHLIEAHKKITAQHLYRDLTVHNIQRAADILMPTYQSSGGVDGFVSLEVPPTVANNPNETLKAARLIWAEVQRPNLMIKIPATMEGILAIEILITEGINVNATLIFAVESYEAVYQAYLRGLAQNPHPYAVASVASCFISRIDARVDMLLDQIGTPDALALKGRTAIANASQIYQRYLSMCKSENFFEQQKRGAKVQRPLWASTSVKNLDYDPLLYVEQLIAPGTINTVPMQVLDAMTQRDLLIQDKPAIMNFGNAEITLSQLNSLGINLQKICAELEIEGVRSFAQAFDALMESLQNKLPQTANC